MVIELMKPDGNNGGETDESLRDSDDDKQTKNIDVADGDDRVVSSGQKPEKSTAECKPIGASNVDVDDQLESDGQELEKSTALCQPLTPGNPLKRKGDQLYHSISLQTVDEASTSTSPNPLPHWVAGASPAKYVTLDELMAMATNLENMALVHEIAINPEFKVEEQPSNAVEKAVKQCMRRAYWDKMREDFACEPPDYSHLSAILCDIKKMIIDVSLPQNVSVRAKLEQLLSDDIANRLTGSNSPDIRLLFENVLNLLGEICAPTRDEMVDQLRALSDPVDMLKGICELLDAMKLDLANFCVDVNRPVIQQHSVEYERKHFMDLVEKTPQLKTATIDWLRRHLHTESSAEFLGPTTSKRRFEDLNNSEINAIISDAYLELLEWDPRNDYPETFQVDREKLEMLAEKYLQLIICTSSVLISCNLAGKNISQLKEFKHNLKNGLIIITNDIDNNNLLQRLEAVAVHCNEKIISQCKEINMDWSNVNRDQLTAQIMNLSDCNNHIRKLIRDRIRQFILTITSTPELSKTLRIPPGLSSVNQELNAVTARFYHIINHNRSVFGAYYGSLIKEMMSDKSS